MMAGIEHEEAERSSDPSAPNALVVVDPLRRSGWDSLLASQPQASIFHGSGLGAGASADLRAYPGLYLQLCKADAWPACCPSWKCPAR